MKREGDKEVRVLVVDDEELLADTLVDSLSHWGYSATAAYGGNEGLRWFKEGDYQLVLLDLVMPDLDGISVFKAIQALNPRVPVIMITAFGSIEAVGEAMREGMYDFVAKPVDMKVLEMIVKQALKTSAL